MRKDKRKKYGIAGMRRDGLSYIERGNEILSFKKLDRAMKTGKYEAKFNSDTKSVGDLNGQDRWSSTYVKDKIGFFKYLKNITKKIMGKIKELLRRTVFSGLLDGRSSRVITPREGDIVDVFNDEGKRVGQKMLDDRTRRMIDLMDAVKKAEATGQYLACVTIFDPKGKTDLNKRNGGNMHNFVFRQNFPNEDIYGSLDEYAKLLELKQ